MVPYTQKVFFFAFNILVADYNALIRPVPHYQQRKLEIFSQFLSRVIHTKTLCLHEEF